MSLAHSSRPDTELRPEYARTEVWSDDAARFYAEALDRSDYGTVIGGALDTALPSPASLLDIGAGAGHPARRWLRPGSGWTALEPNAYLRVRLAACRHPAPRVLDALWQDLPRLALPPHDIAFCANIGGPLEAPRALLALMRQRATRAVAWVVPAQRGPRRWCLAGALPAALHGECEEPAVDRVLAALGPACRPDRTALFGWNFEAGFESLEAAVAYCVDRLPRAQPAAIAAHVAATARRLTDGAVALSAPKLSAILTWDLA